MPRTCSSFNYFIHSWVWDNSLRDQVKKRSNSFHEYAHLSSALTEPKPKERNTVNTMNTETAGITQGESSNETKHVRKMDNTRAFREIGLDVRMLGLCPKTHHMPIVMASGHAIIATWAGTKADVSLFKHTSKGLCVKATFAASGKSVTAPISAVQVPPW